MRPLETTDVPLPRRAGRGALAAVTVACLALAGSAVSASASKIKEEFAPFVDCPTAVAGVCTFAETLSGEFKMGLKSVPIQNPVILQGGLAYNSTLTLPLIAARDGNTMSKTPQTIPGGLTGIEGIGGEVIATAELAGEASDIKVTEVFLGFGHDTAVVLPIKVHLQNELLGENCYIGSDAEPIVLNLTDGTTSPPAPNQPISGKVGTVEDHAHNKIIEFHENSLVDNSFAVPAATGCGTSALLEPIVTTLVNVDAGLPATAGNNTAILNGNFLETQAKWAEKYAKPPKVKKEKPKK